MRPATLLLPLLVLSGMSAAARATTEEAVQVRDRTIIAFLPPEVREAKDDGSIEAGAHLSYAVEDTYKCLQPMKLTIRLLYADRVKLLDNKKKSEVLDVSKMGQAVGAILVEPGRKPQVTYSVEGPSTLQYLLPQAASKYWRVKACEQ